MKPLGLWTFLFSPVNVPIMGPGGPIMNFVYVGLKAEISKTRPKFRTGGANLS